MIIIPHRTLHLLPLHAMYCLMDGRRIYIDDFVQSIIYASSLKEILYGNQRRPSGVPQSKVLSIIDTSAQDLQWMATELNFFRALQMDPGGGENVDIVTADGEVPSDKRPYAAMTWSGHAVSNPLSWGGSYLRFRGQRIPARTIATEWELLSQPVVTLSSCSTAVDVSQRGVMDEYCGLDFAFRIAGARAVYSTLWPVADDVAALGSISFVMWVLQHGASPSAVVATFQKSLRTGRWREFLPSTEQLAAMPSAIRDLLAHVRRDFERLPIDAFAHPAKWAVFRCHGA